GTGPEELLRQVEGSGSPHGVFSYTDRDTGRRYLAGWAVESGFGNYAGQKLIAVARQEYDEATQSAATLLRQFLLLGILSATAIVFTGALLSRRFSRPLVEMAEVAQRISEG